ncbi:MAG: chalcone isomerase family protein [Gammaproteobacteria bacterium]|nr:chalcone isomerase family protein [Gammaproteobacteria bacterium]
MRWLAFNLYNAKLLTPDGYYQKNKWPLALKLTYHKNIKKIDLIQATTDEWERMGVKYSPEWVSKLYTSWPSVNKGDTLLVHIDEQGNSKFYYNNIYVGTINNEVFSKVFLAIWLSDKSRNQVLRRKLIGANKGT